MTVNHVYRQWVDENDVGNTCCLAPKDDPIHTEAPEVVAADAYMEVIAPMQERSILQPISRAIREAYMNGYRHGLREGRVNPDA